MTEEEFFAHLLSGDEWTYDMARFVTDKSGWVEPIDQLNDRFIVVKPFMFGITHVNVGDTFMLSPDENIWPPAMIVTKELELKLTGMMKI